MAPIPSPNLFPTSTSVEPSSPARERVLVEFLRQAPNLPSAGDLAVLSSPVEPWPHQLRVVREAVRRYPESFLFADEVGLGKTIEAGLVLRQLVLSGRVRRALVLVPKALLRQWQEELFEKMVLSIPRLEGGRWLDVFDREVCGLGAGDPGAANPWNAAPLMLASTQLARRRERRAELLAADPWDLVIVDEAHHARRRGLGTETPRPNLLLELLAGDGDHPGLASRSRCLYLLSATPMQVHPLEAFDLLRLLGMGGRWGTEGGAFLRYFEELARPWGQRDWGFLLPMAAEGWERHATALNGSSPVLRRLRESLELEPGARDANLDRWPEDERREIDQHLRRASPFSSFAFRHTRDLLRRYQRQGLLEARIPMRQPENVWIDPTPAEAELYRQIEDTLGELYRRYEARRRGLGFVMTLYRRRLTSSFAAMARSLERRLAWLEGEASPLFEPAEIDTRGEPVVSDTAAGTVEPETGPSGGGDPTTETTEVRGLLAAADREAEHQVLSSYLDALRRLPGDSKIGRLRRDLAEWVGARGKVLVFTQYLDTLDFLRDELVGEHDGAVGCFSGRGGEQWDATLGRWVVCSKESIKEAFRDDDGIRVLLCTEAAGEGLNLQTCGALINFDMPWNPMRVEQRIGRIDRIGQRHDTVWIRNYFYRDTVEAVIYERLTDRIAWFERVVGALQPILQRVASSIEQVALAGPRRAEVLARELGQLEADLATPPTSDLGLDAAAEIVGEEDATILGPLDPPEAPLTWRQLEAGVLSIPTLAQALEPITGQPEVYRWSRDAEDGGDVEVTFSPQQFDRRPYSLRLLTWGEPVFEALLDRLPPEPERERPAGIGVYRTSEPQPVSLFLAPGTHGKPSVLASWDALVAALDRSPGAWGARGEADAASRFSGERRQALQHRATIEEARRGARRRALLARARRVLLSVAHLELARDRTPGLFDTPLDFGFGRRSIIALERHGDPFPRLLALAGEGLETRDDDPGFLDAVGRAPSVLARRLRQRFEEAAEIVQQLEHLEASEAAAHLALREPSLGGGVLDRWWFPVGEAAGSVIAAEPFERLDAGGLRPFVDGLPLYQDWSEVASRFAEPESWHRPQGEERQSPGAFTWVRPHGRMRSDRGLFVAPVTLRALDRRFGAMGHGLFRLLPKQPRPGALVLVAHPALHDPELGEGVALRHAILEPGGLDSQGDWHPARLRLEAASTDPSFVDLVLDDLEEQTPVFLAELVEVL